MTRWAETIIGIGRPASSLARGLSGQSHALQRRRASLPMGSVTRSPSHLAPNLPEPQTRQRYRFATHRSRCSCANQATSILVAADSSGHLRFGAPPTASGIRASLRQIVSAHSSHSQLSELARHNRYAEQVGAPSAGRLTLHWSANTGSDVVAAGVVTFQTAGVSSLMVRAKPAWARYREHRATAHLVETATFTPADGHGISVSVTLAP
jgi:hypothetical protein